MRNQPHVKQKDISETLGITIQAISKYFKKLTKEGLLESGSERADYRLTPKAISNCRKNCKLRKICQLPVKHDMKVEHPWPPSQLNR